MFVYGQTDQADIDKNGVRCQTVKCHLNRFQRWSSKLITKLNDNTMDRKQDLASKEGSIMCTKIEERHVIG